MEYFRQYLDSKGSELSKTTELLSFYALPYIPKPSEHAGFKQLFTAEWVNNLTEKLSTTLHKQVISQTEDNEVSLLEEIYAAAAASSHPNAAAAVTNNDGADLHNFITDNSYAHENTGYKNNDAQYLNVL